MLTGYKQNKRCNCNSKSHLLNCGINIKKGDIFNYKENSYGIKSKSLIDYRPTACIKYEKSNTISNENKIVNKEMKKQQQQEQEEGKRKNRYNNNDSFYVVFLFSYNNVNNNNNDNNNTKNKDKYNYYINNDQHKIKSFEPITMITPVVNIQNHDQYNNDHNEGIITYSNYIMSVNKLNYHPSSSSINKNNNVGIQNAKIIRKEGNLLIGMIRYCDIIDDDDQDMFVLIRQIQDEAVCLYTFGVKFIILIRLDTVLCSINKSSSHSKYQEKSVKLLLSSLYGYIDLLMIYQNENDDHLKSNVQQSKITNKHNNKIPVISLNSRNDKILFSVRRSIQGILHVRYFNYSLALFD